MRDIMDETQVFRPRLSFDSLYRFNRSLLRADDRILYDQIDGALLRGEPSMSFIERGDCSIGRYMAVLEAVLQDDPWLFYASTGLTVRTCGQEVTLEFNYNRFYGDRQRLADTFRWMVSEIFSRHISGCRTEYEAELMLHDHLAATVVYDGSDDEASHCLVGPLIHGRGVCQGVASAFMLLADCCGLKAACTSGELDGGPHGWNIVKIGDRRYHVDVTSDLDGSRHSYFNCSDAMMSRTHVSAQRTRCMDDSLNYYVMNGTWFRDASSAVRGMGRILRTVPDRTEFYVEGTVDDREMIDSLTGYFSVRYTIQYSNGRFCLQREGTVYRRCLLDPDLPRRHLAGEAVTTDSPGGPGAHDGVRNEGERKGSFQDSARRFVRNLFRKG